MNDLVDFLTSQEIIVVYVISAVACLLCIIIYLVEKNNIRIRQKHNTRELNKLVEQVQEETKIEEKPVVYEEPILETIDDNIKNNSQNNLIIDEVVVEPLANSDIVQQEVKTPSALVKEEEKDELEYTTIEPDQATAQLELKRLTEELKKQSEVKEDTITITDYESQQEENAIISLEELVKKSKKIYEANELTQYVDEGNEPISLKELESRSSYRDIAYDEPFIIENVVPKEELEEIEKEDNKESLILDDFESIKVEPEKKVFQSSPVISPIYGIEKQGASQTDLELENTANYDKLDDEIKKTNEFLMTLKELQSKLD